jgi:hypothetical protein
MIDSILIAAGEIFLTACFVVIFVVMLLGITTSLWVQPLIVLCEAIGTLAGMCTNLYCRIVDWYESRNTSL